MIMKRILCASVLTVALGNVPARASEVIVPDDYATITLAVASGADTVSVRQGTYPESLTIARVITLRGLGPDGPSLGGYPSFDQPTLLAVNVPSQSSVDGVLALLDLHVERSVTLWGMHTLVQGCRLDAGLSASYSNRCDLQYCHATGDVSIGGYLSDIGMNRITGATLYVGAGAGTMRAHDNIIIGPALIGISVIEDGEIAGNYVRGCTNGISGGGYGGILFSANVVEDCSGSGFICGRNCVAINNTARRCGNRGFDCQFAGFIASNLVDSTGREGIAAELSGQIADNTVLRSGGTGIAVSIYSPALSGNRVIGAGGDGMVVGPGGFPISKNVVGRSHGRGIVVQDRYSGYRVDHNTVFLNGGAGISLVGDQSGDVDSVTNNISFGDSVGLQWSGNVAPLLSCNDWYGDRVAAVSGTPPSLSDISLDPAFCALAYDNVSLSGGSPLVNFPGCGLVGALGVGCTVPASVPTTGVLQAPFRLSVSPQPGRGPIQFSWRAGLGGAHLEVYDVSGARRWSTSLAAAQSTFQWSGAGDDGRALPAGVYFAKLSQDASRSEARVIILR